MSDSTILRHDNSCSHSLHPLRVAFLTPSLQVGGAEQVILTLAEHFNRDKCLPVGVWLTTNFLDPTFIHRVRQVMPVFWPAEPITADAIISWGIPHLKQILPDAESPIVDVSHSDGTWQQQSDLLLRSCVGATHLVAVSEAAKTAFPAIVRDKVTVIRNGVDPQRVKPIRGREAQRRIWGISPGQKLALFLGRFAEVKGPEYLLAALQHLPFEWVAGFIGHGPDEAALKSAAEHFPGRVFISPPIREVGDALAAADVLVQPSQCEGHSLTINEAWLAGLPVVTTTHRWVCEMIDLHGAMARLVCNPSTPKELAEAIEEACDSPTDHARMVAEEHYTARIMATNWENYLRDDVCRKPEGAPEGAKETKELSRV